MLVQELGDDGGEAHLPEEPLPCHRFPPSAQILPHYHAVLPHHTMPELTRSYHTTILLLLLPHHARVESDLVAVASSGQEQPRPNASIHHPQPFPDWDQHNFYQMLSAKKTNCIYACFLGFWVNYYKRFLKIRGSVPWRQSQCSKSFKAANNPNFKILKRIYRTNHLPWL